MKKGCVSYTWFNRAPDDEDDDNDDDKDDNDNDADGGGGWDLMLTAKSNDRETRALSLVNLDKLTDSTLSHAVCTI